MLVEVNKYTNNGLAEYNENFKYFDMYFNIISYLF